ncbi:hypothetical protein TNCV_1146261 [Trichonephila clavipes]|nr:hypothetical protein TNCV_1146261 [Trichonephila clavipes]
MELVYDLLNRTLGNACLKYEELNSLLYERESVVNSRQDDNELEPLIPSTPLQEFKECRVADLDYLESIILQKKGFCTELNFMKTFVNISDWNI